MNFYIRKAIHKGKIFQVKNITSFVRHEVKKCSLSLCGVCCHEVLAFTCLHYDQKNTEMKNFVKNIWWHCSQYMQFLHGSIQRVSIKIPDSKDQLCRLLENKANWNIANTKIIADNKQLVWTDWKGISFTALLEDISLSLYYHYKGGWMLSFFIQTTDVIKCCMKTLLWLPFDKLL